MSAWEVNGAQTVSKQEAATKIQEMTGKKVVRLLGREREIRDKFSKTQHVEMQFTDVVEQIGLEFGAADEILSEWLLAGEKKPSADAKSLVGTLLKGFGAREISMKGKKVGVRRVENANRRSPK